MYWGLSIDFVSTHLAKSRSRSRSRNRHQKNAAFADNRDNNNKNLW